MVVLLDVFFCGTGKKFVRNLTNNEIVQQIKDVLINEEIINYTNDIKKFQIMFMSMENLC